MVEPHQDHHAATSVGERLRRTREAQGLTLDDVATRTRIPIRHLRSIEDSQWDELPAITYTVGFGRSYANAIGLDGAEVGRQLREQLGGTPRTSQMSTEYYAPADPARVPSRSMAWIAGILALALVVGYLIWRSQLGDDEQAAAMTDPQPQAVQQAPAPQPQAAPAPADMSGQQVTLTATEEVWLRITDQAGGGALQQGSMQAGQQFAVPLSARQPVVQTGRPQVLRVRIGDRELGTLDTVQRTVSGVSLLSNDLAQRLTGQPQPASGAAAAQNGAQPR
jgi:transcriptional regulator with XRE-family HTH domain